MSELSQPPSLTLRLPIEFLNDDSLASKVVLCLRQGTERRDPNEVVSRHSSLVDIQETPKLNGHQFVSKSLIALNSRRSNVASPKFSEETKYLLQNPLSNASDIISPKGNFSAILESYRFVVGLDDADELVYDDRPFETSYEDSFVGRARFSPVNKSFS
jgi:hypothetical protein